ncbi:MAG: Fe-S cluster assembly protein HesB, partial [Frankiales bacterium]|nr:Fe-S cluster assembly protein HesB [Frankiales bacterium]
MTLWLTDDHQANRLLERDPLALLLAMALDQQIPMEKAFKGPYVLRERTGADLSAADLAERLDLAELFSQTPAIHRFPGSMAGRMQELCRALVADYDGRAEALWEDAA